MEPIDFSKAKQEGKGFQFPGDFEIPAVGKTSANLPTHVPQLLDRAGLHVFHETVRHRQSGEGNFISVTVTIRCESRERYEAAHEALRASPDIKYTM